MKYKLKNNYLDKNTINRVVKDIINYTKDDRAKATEICEAAQQHLTRCMAGPPDEAVNAINAAVNALKGLQTTNQSVLKVLEILSKWLISSASGKDGSKGKEEGRSLFEQLQELSRSRGDD